MPDAVSLDLIFQQETFADVIEEIKPLLERHWQEIARNQDRIPFNPDYRIYTALGQQRHLRIYTTRLSGKLVGYAVYFLRKHPHYQDHTWAVSDIFWVSPEIRGRKLGRRLFEFVESSLKAEGVAVMHTTSKVEHPAARAVLEDLGHTLIEYGHAKVLLEN